MEERNPFNMEDLGSFQDVFQALPYRPLWKQYTLILLDEYLTEDIVTPEEKQDIIEHAKALLYSATITDSFDDFKETLERGYKDL